MGTVRPGARGHAAPACPGARAQRHAGPGPCGGGGRDLHRRLRRRPGVPGQAGPHRRAVPAESVQLRARRQDVPDRRHRALARGSVLGGHRARGPPGQGARLPHRAGRDRKRPLRSSRCGGSRRSRVRGPRPPPAGRLLHAAPRRGARRRGLPGAGSALRRVPARLPGRAATRLHGARIVHRGRPAAAGARRHGRPAGSPGARDRRQREDGPWVFAVAGGPVPPVVPGAADRAGRPGRRLLPAGR